MASMIPTWGAKMASNNLSSSCIHFNPTDWWQPGDCSVNRCGGVGDSIICCGYNRLTLRPLKQWGTNKNVARGSMLSVRSSHSDWNFLQTVKAHLATRGCSNAKVSLTLRQGVRADDALWRKGSSLRTSDEGQLPLICQFGKGRAFFVIVSSVCSNCSTTRWLH